MDYFDKERLLILPTCYRSETRGNWTVSATETEYIPEIKELNVLPVLGPSDFYGQGLCYGQALDDYIHKFEQWYDRITEFYLQILKTQEAHIMSVNVDFNDEPLESHMQGNILMNVMKERYEKWQKNQKKD